MSLSVSVCSHTSNELAVRTDGWTFETHFIKSTQKSRPTNTSQLQDIFCARYQRPWLGPPLTTMHYVMQCTSGYVDDVVVHRQWSIYSGSAVDSSH